MKKVTVWYSIRNAGVSAYPRYFLSEEKAERDQRLQDEGWGEPCYGPVETFEGSNVHVDAVENEATITEKQMRGW